MTTWDSDHVDGLNRAIEQQREEIRALTGLVGDRVLDSDLALEATKRERQRVLNILQGMLDNLQALEAYSAVIDPTYVRAQKEGLQAASREIVASAQREGR